MKTTELAMRAYESGMPQVAITHGNERVTIRVKFPQSQTFEIWYPEIMAPWNEELKYASVFDHIVIAEYYWFVMANSSTAEMYWNGESQKRKLLCKRANTLLNKCIDRGYGQD